MLTAKTESFQIINEKVKIQYWTISEYTRKGLVAVCGFP